MRRNILFVIFFISLLYGSSADKYFFDSGMIGFKPMYWQFVTIGFALVLLVTLQSYKQFKISNNYIIWLILFLANSIFSYLYSMQGKVEDQALIEGFRAVALLFSFYVIFSTNEDAQGMLRLAMFVVILISVPINMIDFVHPIWSRVPGRAAGLYVNPTISGAILVIAMVISVSVVPYKIRLFYCAFIGVGVLLTFSRGPWLFWVIAVTALAYTGHIRVGRKGLSIVIAGLFSGLIVYGALTGGVLEYFTKTGLDAFLTQDTLSRIGGSGSAFTDNSTSSRVVVAEKAWLVFAENPWLGAGLGVEQNWSVGSHNTFLRMAAEGGILRLALYIWLFLFLWNMTDKLGKVTLIIYFFSSLTSHNNLQSPVFLMFLAFIATTTNNENVRNDKSLLPNLRSKAGI